ncbi:7-carboxy-7-deazaguanine synthase QueE [Rhodospirillum rubrum]|uniref:7-carboxy-7-deazaguanine synthase n=1 Tax=Rhodospirillum rubrum (strain ATCC 11170 / ATH 1.1.1 / DSM 467 / LMG 4362 / NCIMB 8255 / S1) TaxID=269796 RepID=QUEE_RHORT|nr:7-carboxy-7-deazaguanine synthase QueE [Rhodospirillum rubrum]Q2RSY6.1 RecName: Full=7-carboxy-7-deazaguanine synthase; Short=CDG synthase; AltName: Full=Queuosine biosynthesis protein QueE [Rhodospirillum rubrum ATCC 11170]ABC22759.1 Radical SAM [Rhodospirillum rubrum ATCC 11170]AEO48480.1 radical SAM family protein [Rhodospirillum rubrum F11]MBK5954356.1 7-carboxy-7-deazaguanine synthase [Rhodospirillum rubrum]QXG78750.1 7-carboxy-7-deazaguanine synthase QueE [Rhodospirillum rubrum]HAQ00
MFGRNPARGPDPGDGESLWIQEVFYTLQGEGPFSGQPSVFVRTAGCNLRCAWCDTDFESSAWKPPLPELLAVIDSRRPRVCDLVVLTGGEPLRQEVGPLVRALLARGLRVQIETNGTLWRDLPFGPGLSIVCSPKTRTLDPQLVPRIDAFKYVIAAGETDPTDGLPALSTQHPGRAERLFRPPPGVPVFVMPRDDHGTPARPGRGEDDNLAEAAASALRFGYRLCVQVHKILKIA